MKVALLGGGFMGYAILYDFLHNYPDIQEIIVVEKNAERINYLWKQFPNQNNLSFLQLDITETDQLKNALLGYRLLISAVPYQYNLELLKLALEIGAHFIDLGGNETVLQQQLALDEKARKLGVTAIPACGLAPGLVSILAMDGIKRLDRTETVKMYCGGLPQHKLPPLDYQIVFSAHGLLNEYLEPVKVIENGKIMEKPPLTEMEAVHFSPPYTSMEAFLTSGGTGTLIYTQQDRVENLFYKTIRYPGHADKMRFLFELGFKSEEPIAINGQEVSPRQFLETLLQKNLTFNAPDVVLTRVEVSGVVEDTPRKMVYELVDVQDDVSGLSAMMRTTGFTTAIIAQLILEGVIDATGVLPLEESVPTDVFFQRLKQRNLIINRSVQ